MKHRFFPAILLVFAGLLSLYIRNIDDKEFTHIGQAMNTIIRITSFGINAVDDAYSLLQQLDNSLSMYNPSSDISMINSNAGIKPLKVHDDTVEVIRHSVRLHDLTHGVFNPLIGSVTRLWKINRQDNSIPSPQSLDEAVKLSAIDNLQISGDTVFLKHNGCVLDLGGIAKGFASEKIADLLKSKGVQSAMIDLGGNVYAVGKKTDGSNWRIGVRNPLEPYGSPALVLDVHDCAVITSGSYERFKTVDGKKYSHFFDTKTGNSIMSDLLSVTVITPDGSLADGLATAFMISGVDEAFNVLSAMENVPGVIFISHDGITATDNLRNTISAVISSTSLTFREVQKVPAFPPCSPAPASSSSVSSPSSPLSFQLQVRPSHDSISPAPSIPLHAL